MEKESTAVGYEIRMNLNSDWVLVNSINRTVAVRKVEKGDENFLTCQDCKAKSEYIIVELSRFTPKGRKNEHNLIWGWCGVCDIGRN
jgi:hypothetical protein